MNIERILRRKVESLEPGPALTGMQAVLSHISVAIRHLERGQVSRDESAFTDAVYRCNQAFEGSIREAYRVLAEGNPSEKRLFDIEAYLDKNDILRSRVRAMFTQYRKDWRNPSTHDHTLSFSESEAYVAVTAVTAFATVLCDEILQRMAFRRAQTDPELHKFALAIADSRKDEPSVWSLASAMADIGRHISTMQDQSPATESQIIGLMSGLLVAMPFGFAVDADVALGPDRRHHPDLLVRAADQRFIVEVKRGKPTRSAVSSAVEQVERYLSIADLDDGVVFFAPETQSNYMTTVHQRAGGRGTILVVHPDKGAISAA